MGQEERGAAEKAEQASRIDVPIASVPGAELRLVGELLPFLSAHIEHCVLCPRCTGKAGVVDMHCAGCDCTGYVERRVCMEGECEACDRFDSLVQPGCDIEDGTVMRRAA